MKNLLERMDFTPSEIDKLAPEIEKFLSSKKELEKIQRDIKRIKVSLILLVSLVALLIVQ